MEENGTEFLQYSLILSPALQNKINQHVLINKKLLFPGKNKREWLNEALDERLAINEDPKLLQKVTRITLRMNLLLYNKLNERFQLIFHLRGGWYSKKQWILDAINEQLELEERALQR